MEQIKIIWELPPWLTNPDNLQALIQKEVNIKICCDLGWIPQFKFFFIDLYNNLYENEKLPLIITIGKVRIRKQCEGQQIYLTLELTGYNFQFSIYIFGC